MRLVGALVALLVTMSAVLAQGTVEFTPYVPPAPPAAEPAKPAAKPKAKPKPAAAAPAPAAPALRDAYAAMTPAERTALQSDLTWTGDYNGPINGEFSERLVAAAKAFQKRSKGKETGLLSPEQRAALAAAAKPLQDTVGWRLVEDPATGVRLGLPGRIATESAPTGAGTSWRSAQGQLQIETFRIAGAATLEGVFEQQKKEPANRRVTYQALRPDFFVLSGTQGLKRFYVRVFAQDGELRGFSVAYDQAMEGFMNRVVVAMSGAFIAFGNGMSLAATGSAGQPAPHRKVEYATGLLVSPAGHIVAGRQATDGCEVIVVHGLGHAERLAEAGELALLRIYGARELLPAALSPAAPAAGPVTLVGVADPQAQAGAAAASTLPARLGPPALMRTLEPAPAPGFSGAAVLDGDGKVAGIAVLKSALVAGPGVAASAAMVPVEAVIGFLKAHGVAAGPGRAGTDGVKAATARVICVRP